MGAIAQRKFSPGKLNELVVVGKDVLELLSSAMYIDPLAIYREYIQNAADAIDDADKERLYADGSRPRIVVSIDRNARTIRISDNGTGIRTNAFARSITALGASKKRGSDARGFRGVGRLCGLAYCEQLIFRSKSKTSPRVWEARFDCCQLKTLLNDSEFRGDINDVLYEIVDFDTFEDSRGRRHFFEVELRRVSRVADDSLLNPTAVRNYISQVGPVPFRRGFSFAARITKHLSKHALGKTYNIYLNDDSVRIERPLTNRFAAKQTQTDTFLEFETFEVPGINGGIDAVGWLLHHNYYGALSAQLGFRGFRLRRGNLQIGDDEIFQTAFPEPRFNSWSIGEVHLLSPRLVPNGRRDNLEHNVHQQNLLNHVGQHAKQIAKRCRAKSAERTRQKDRNRRFAKMPTGWLQSQRSFKALDASRQRVFEHFFAELLRASPRKAKMKSAIVAILPKLCSIA